MHLEKNPTSVKLHPTLVGPFFSVITPMPRHSCSLATLFCVDIEVPPYVPERFLLLAMLYRALKDLEVPGVTRQEAILWFEGISEVKPCKSKFTFQDCDVHLSLDHKQKRFIEQRLKEAKSLYGKQNSERKTYRKRSGWFPKGPSKERLCEEDPTVFGNGRYFRCHLRRVEKLAYRMQSDDISGADTITVKKMA